MLLYRNSETGMQEVYLGLRRYNPGAGKWSVPGGEVEEGESFWQAACREVREETGIPESWFGLYERQEHPVVRIWIPFLFSWRTFVVRLPDGAPAPSRSHEFRDDGWFPAHEPPGPLHIGTAQAIRKIPR